MLLLLIVAYVCQPQYWVQNPDDAVTFDEVNTKYTPLVSFGNRPEVIALETIVLMLLSDKRVLVPESVVSPAKVTAPVTPV